MKLSDILLKIIIEWKQSLLNQSQNPLKHWATKPLGSFILHRQPVFLVMLLRGWAWHYSPIKSVRKNRQ